MKFFILSKNAKHVFLIKVFSTLSHLELKKIYIYTYIYNGIKGPNFILPICKK